MSPEAKRQCSTSVEENAAEGCQEKRKCGANLGSKPPHRFLLNLATKLLSFESISAHLFHSKDTTITVYCIDSILQPANSCYIHSPKIQRKLSVHSILHSFLRGSPKVTEGKISISLPFLPITKQPTRFFPVY